MRYDDYKNSNFFEQHDSSEEINVIRSAYPDVEITSYTYDSKLGTTRSKTENNGVSNYYTYDDFGRLLNIRDNKQNVIKSFEYTDYAQ